MGTETGDFEARLAALRKRYHSRLPERLQQIQDHWHLVEVGGADGSSNLIRLYRDVHNLMGSAATYEYAEISQAAHTLELVLRDLTRPGAVLTDENRAEVEQRLKVLRQVVEDPE